MGEKESEPKRILIVEDDEAGARLLARHLSKNGYEVTVEFSSFKALNLVKEAAYDLVLSDIIMPGISGIEMCRRLRQDNRSKSIPVILISARDEVESIVEGLDAGADDYVAKPFHPEELLARVRTQLRIKELQDRLLASEQAKVVGELAGAAAHEINQPLTILLGYAEMMLPMIADDANLKSKLDQIITSAHEISRVVKTIQNLKTYKTTTYIDEKQILDLYNTAITAGDAQRGMKDPSSKR